MHLENICVAVLTALAATCASAQAAPGNWDAAYTKARTALAKLSLADKVGIVTGVGWNQGPCVGNVHAASAIGFPSLCLQDGPLGVRYAKSITAFTPGVQAASTWDVNLMHQRGEFLGVEAKQLGVHVMLGPSAGPLGKIPEGGRNWEGFSPDPYLSGEGMRATIEGMQSAGVQATAKHWILNEQELNRNTMSSQADDRTVHELYAWPFMDAVKADVAAFMCSYNQVNGTFACENSYVMKELLKEQLGFKGLTMTDWGAQHSTNAAANTGLDMSMPGSNFNGGDVYWGQALLNSVNSGAVALSRVEDMVLRILAPWYMLGQDQGYPSVDLTRQVQGNHKTNVRAVARDGTVLLKNDNRVLPLKSAASKIAVVGTGAYKGNHANNAASCPDKACNSGALGMGWGSGAVDYPYFVAPYDAIAAKISSTGGSVVQSNSDNASQGATAARGADVAVVFITADGGEGYLTSEGVAGDRNNLDPWHNGNALVKAVADANSNVIVVVHSIGPIILESVLSNPSVKAIVWAGLPSQESGNALVDVLWGDVNPSGKLVYTIAKQQADYGTKVSQGTDTFKEGLFIDYRHFDQSNIAPRYEFGFGLSYTNFTYSGLAVSAVSATSGPTTGTIVPGGPQDLWQIVATVTAKITNSGGVQGAEVAQLYITLPTSAPSTPPRQLRGFAKLPLAPGASGTATFALTRRDLSYWDVNSKKWILPKGQFGVSVGASSRDLRLNGSLVVA